MVITYKFGEKVTLLLAGRLGRRKRAACAAGRSILIRRRTVHPVASRDLIERLIVPGVVIVCVYVVRYGQRTTPTSPLGESDTG